MPIVRIEQDAETQTISQSVSKLRRTWPAIKTLILAKTYPLAKRFEPAIVAWQRLTCHLNFHQLEDAPVMDPKTGAILPNEPARFRHCKRCGAITDYADPRDVSALMENDDIIEVPDFTVLAKKNCKTCYGRGFKGRMIVAPGIRAMIPCNCTVIQPRYTERVVGGA